MRNTHTGHTHTGYIGPTVWAGQCYTWDNLLPEPLCLLFEPNKLHLPFIQTINIQWPVFFRIYTTQNGNTCTHWHWAAVRPILVFVGRRGSNMYRSNIGHIVHITIIIYDIFPRPEILIIAADIPEKLLHFVCIMYIRRRWQICCSRCDVINVIILLPA